ncbi:hypothetical protein ARC20_09210 [Stenotrophomonas panacihumi]|uniref:DUF6311 domain-containing protein n=1 Tax=Stenotrophomonas panacihumi TaxID=676599 RepID=A0A0R0AF08_9GAMM|nr:hypothetical protein [Stenotrophomonas panacihumi]KRG43606.1 hypothetical protein ARC20_09210 [Stenotrophomonas panacihumi]PTN55353.1 hypothetical protein C9J98_05830 [Stenotrophomonas panacihumi]
MQQGLGLGRHRNDQDWRWLAPVVLLALGFWFVPLAHTCHMACVPGDLGDARFNGVILEHFYRWLAGKEASLLSPSFFFPMPGAVTFSDNHWGTGWLYSLYRLLGADRYQAFDLWYMGGYVANFIACHWVLRKLGFSPVAGALGAFAFAFAMPVIARHGHAQLVYRFLIPVALLLWQRFRETARWSWLGWLALAICGQFYLSIYLGYFLALFLGAWAVAQAVVERSAPWRWFTPGLRLSEPTARRDLLFAVAMGLVALVALAGLMYPYLHYSKLYGFQRDAQEIASLLPRLRSYVLADGSAIWAGVSARLAGDLPMRHEQQIFFGLGISGLALLGLLKSSLRMRWVALLAIALLVVLTVSVRGHSLYLLLASLPGVNSIRAMARIGLVLAMPVAVLVAVGVDAVRGRGEFWRLPVAALALLMIVESTTMRTVNFDAAQARTGTLALQAGLPTPLPADALVFVPLRPDNTFINAQLDGMVLGQTVDRPTLNGYSGNLAPGYWPLPRNDVPACAQAARRLRAAAAFYMDHLHAPLPAAAGGPVVLPGQPACPPGSWTALPLEDFRLVSLNVLSVQREPSQYRVRVQVRNGSDFVLDATPAAQPTRLSWQKLQPGAAVDPAAWSARVEIGDGLDLAPGEQREIEFVVPASTHDGDRLALGMLIEGRAWFHDQGVPPVITPLPVEQVQ